MLSPVFKVFFWPFSVFQRKLSFSRSGVIVFTVIYNNSRSIVFQTKGCCICSCYLWYSCISACNELWNTRQARAKSKSSTARGKKHFISESTLSENNVPTNAWTILIHTTALSWQRFCNRVRFAPLQRQLGGVFRLKNVQVHLYFFIYIYWWSSIMRKSDWLKKPALWEYKTRC